MSNDKIAKTGDNTTIKTKAINLSIIVLLIYLLILPTFGVGIDFQESLIFYSLPFFIYFNLQFEKNPFNLFLTKLGLFFYTTLFTLLVLSTYFSLNIGMSYYFFWCFVIVLFITNLTNIILPNITLLYRPIIYFSLAYCFVFLINKVGIIQLPPRAFGDNFIAQIWGHSYLGNFLIFPIIIILSKLNKLKALVIFFILCLFLTNSRSAFVGLIVSLPFINFPYKKIIVSFCLISLSILLFMSSRQGQSYKNLTGSRPQYFSQALIGFSQSPLLGNGPNTFDIINRQLIKYGESGANTSHNSVLDFLTNNGLLFTLIIVFLILSGLQHQYKNNRLLFALGIASFSSSLIDSFWANFGMLSLSLIFILYQHPLLYSTNPKNKTQTHYFLGIQAVLILIFFLSKTISDFLYMSGSYATSLKIDPFNLNSRLAILQDVTPATLKLFQNEPLVYTKLISTIPLPTSQDYYLKLITLDPQHNLDNLLKLLDSAHQTKNTNLYQKIDDLNLPLDPKIIPSTAALKLSLNYFDMAIYLWQSAQKENSLKYFQKAAFYSPLWSQFQIELANAYWHTNHSDLALATLQKCTQIPTSQSHCTSYLNTYQNTPFELPDDPEWLKSVASIKPSLR